MDKLIVFKKAFNEESSLAKWIIGLAMIHNDLLIVKRRLLSDSNKDIGTLFAELPYTLRVLASSLREAVFYLEESLKDTDITNHLKQSSDEITKQLEKFKPLFKGTNDNNVLQRLSNIRNVTYHYSKHKRDEIRSALISLSNSVISFDIDKEMFSFADAVSNTILVRALFSDKEIFDGRPEFVDQIMKSVNNGFNDFIDFSNRIVRDYIKNI
jgi:hypothetical protein